jgi:FlaA1/EpsC-like NDP-sugar epimerase
MKLNVLAIYFSIFGLHLIPLSASASDLNKGVDYILASPYSNVELTSDDFKAILKDLGREVQPINDHGLSNFLENKNILVTGGSGSIGSEIVRQACKYKPKQIIVLDQCEFTTFQVKGSIDQFCSGIKVNHVLGSVTDPEFLDHLVKSNNIDIIYHAAAYKHVHLMEENPYQALKNNVGGTRNLLQAAAINGVKTFVNISTDKAVNPSCVMGASKRINELLIRKVGETQGPGSRFLSVRFGNVFGSSGSVGPIFEKQIRSGGPVTVTDPKMTRFMMSISEAAQLVLVSSSFPQSQDGIYVLDMGQPIKILDLAESMIRYMGRPEVEIKITGIRKGEKIHEILNTSNEILGSTSNSRIRVVQDSEVTGTIFWDVKTMLDDLSPSMTGGEVRELVHAIVSDYSSHY